MARMRKAVEQEQRCGAGEGLRESGERVEDDLATVHFLTDGIADGVWRERSVGDWSRLAERRPSSPMFCRNEATSCADERGEVHYAK